MLSGLRVEVIEKETGQRVIDRAAGLCEAITEQEVRCRAPGVVLHHRKFKGMGGRKGEAKRLINLEDNLQLLCHACHRRAHGLR